MNTINTLLDIKGRFAQLKQDVRAATGSYKYDDCYDDCVKEVDVVIARLEANPDKEMVEMAGYLAFQLGYDKKEILKFMKEKK